MRLKVYLLLVSIITTNSFFAQKDSLVSVLKPKDLLLHAANGSTRWDFPYDIGLDYLLSKHVSVGFKYVNIVTDVAWTNETPQEYANGHFLKAGYHYSLQKFFFKKLKNDFSISVLGGFLNWKYSETSVNKYPNYSVGFSVEEIVFIKHYFGIYIGGGQGWHFQGGPKVNYIDFTLGVVFRP